MGIEIEDATDRKDVVGDIARLVQRLQSCVDEVRCNLTDLPSESEVEAIRERLPEQNADGLLALLRRLPRNVGLEWWDRSAELGGSLSYALEEVPKLDRWRKEDADEWADGLDHYYGVWAESNVFLRVDEGSAYVAVHESDTVLWLDDVGDAELNGTKLAASPDDFWEKWQAMAFLDLSRTHIEEVRETGFGPDTPLGERLPFP